MSLLDLARWAAWIAADTATRHLHAPARVRTAVARRRRRALGVPDRRDPTGRLVLPEGTDVVTPPEWHGGER